MNGEITIYHGSQQIVEVPKYGVGKTYNDYGQGFYCTENLELAKEWACPVQNDGYANQYRLNWDGLNVIRLTGQGTDYHIMNWLAILLQNRAFDINSPVGDLAKTYVLENFLPDVSGVDVMIGYRADDSYFSFAEDFVNSTMSLRDLNMAMHLGTLGEQIVLLSPKAFEQIRFLGYETADYREYYYKRSQRDQEARGAYKRQKKSFQALQNDLFILDIIRGEMKNDDPRLRQQLFE